MTDPAPSQTGTVLRAATIAAAVLLLLWLLWSVVLLAFFAVLLGATLRGVADWLAVRTGTSASWLLALVTLLLAALAVGFALLVGPALAQQSADLANGLMDEAGALQRRYGDTEWGHRILGRLQSLGAGPGSFAAPAFRVLGRTLRRWLLGQLADMTIIGVSTGLGLGLLGVPVSLALGAIAGLLTFIPYFGAVLAGVPAVLVALSVGPHLALLTLGVFLLVHLVDGYLISPLIQRRMVELPPAVTVMAMTAAGTLFGPLGIVLGTPLAAAGTVVVCELYVADTFGDDEVQARP